MDILLKYNENQTIPHTVNTATNLIGKQNIPHTVNTATKFNRKTKHTTLSTQLQNLIGKQNIPHCQNSYKI